MEVLQQDVEWLRQHKIMDYSLLIGIAALDTTSIHKQAPDEVSRRRIFNLWTPSRLRGRSSSIGMPLSPSDEGGGEFMEPPHRGFSDSFNSTSETETSSVSGGDDPPEQQPPGGGGGPRYMYFFGIVDVLQEYSFKKKIETYYKTGLYSIEGKDPRGLSVVNPTNYGKRFLHFMEQHIA